jgi:S-adenosylmethionine:tRNA ribosyltransferase-isomerase
VHLTFAEILVLAGAMPIPPYLKRDSEAVDINRYQTVYAKNHGSVAAPTAGLHFTENVFENLKAKNISTDEVTLHVGAGTFQPVKSETVGGHQMHAELIDVKIETIENILSSLTKTIIVVGTTSLRTVETLYWMGVKAKLNSVAIPDELEIKQWDVYQLSSDVAVADALQALVQWMKNKQLQRLVCKTQILIAPPYKLKVASALITNFHQPNSTLLLLVAAVAGNNWKTIYNYALENNFRFLSYGDSSLLYAG